MDKIRDGRDWREEITRGILEADIVLVFLSKHSMRKESVCLNELAIAVGIKHNRIRTVLLEQDA